jgi:hypothetical protein
MPSSTDGNGNYKLLKDGNIKQALARIQSKIDEYDLAYIIIPYNCSDHYVFKHYVTRLFGNKVEVELMRYPKNIMESRRFILDNGSSYINSLLSELEFLELVETELPVSSISIPAHVKCVNVYLNNSPRDDINQPVNSQAKILKGLLNELATFDGAVNFYANNQGQIDSKFANDIILDIQLAPVLYSHKVVKTFNAFTSDNSAEIHHVLYPYRLNDPSYDSEGFLALEDTYKLLCTNPTCRCKGDFGFDNVEEVSTAFNWIEEPFYVFAPPSPDFVFHHSIVEFIEAGCKFINGRGRFVDFSECEALSRCI